MIDPEEKGDLEYRKAQLVKLQNEVVDIEEMQSGVSIMELGLNEFRLDLLEYVKHNGDLDKVIRPIPFFTTIKHRSHRTNHRNLLATIQTACGRISSFKCAS